ncbi:MAG: hypothetical protein KKH28_04850 [Elusimicrobia bacterium]|nr:hypothetical protein [Elusimicrobiota bacterium]
MELIADREWGDGGFPARSLIGFTAGVWSEPLSLAAARTVCSSRTAMPGRCVPQPAEDPGRLPRKPGPGARREPAVTPKGA